MRGSRKPRRGSEYSSCPKPEIWTGQNTERNCNAARPCGMKPRLDAPNGLKLKFGIYSEHRTEKARFLKPTFSVSDCNSTTAVNGMYDGELHTTWYLPIAETACLARIHSASIFWNKASEWSVRIWTMYYMHARGLYIFNKQCSNAKFHEGCRMEW